MKPFEIQTGKGERKSRTFRATLAGSLCWDGALDDKNPGERARPIWMLWVGSKHELRAFFANLRMGRVAWTLEGDLDRVDLSLPKSHRYQIRWRGEDCAEMFAPSFFGLDPEDPEGPVRFVLSPPKAWLDRQGQDPKQATASLLAAYLDRRTAVPLLRAPKFHRALYEDALKRGFLVPSQRRGIFVQTGDVFQHDPGFEALPFGQALRFWCFKNLDPYLFSFTETFLKENPDHGETCISGPSGIFSDADGAGEQLRLFPAA